MNNYLDQFQQVPDYLLEVTPDDQDAYDIPSFPSPPTLSFKGKEWSILHRDFPKPVPFLDPTGRYPAQFVDVVVVRYARFHAKRFFAEVYQEGDNNPPDCWSHDGQTPAADVPAPVASYCQTCPNNARNSGANGRGRACRDFKDLALIPIMPNGAIADVTPLGGPLLLRVPPDSLTNLSHLTKDLIGRGIVPERMVIRLSCAAGSAHPKLEFNPVRYITQAEFDITKRWRNDVATVEMLHLDTPPVPPQQAAIAHQPETPINTPPPPRPASTPAAAPAMATAPRGRGRPPRAAPPASMAPPAPPSVTMPQMELTPPDAAAAATPMPPAMEYDTAPVVQPNGEALDPTSTAAVLDFVKQLTDRHR